jgi:hypothetical protein
MVSANSHVAKAEARLFPVSRWQIRKNRGNEKKKKTALSTFIPIRYGLGSLANRCANVRSKNQLREENPSTLGDPGVKAMTPVFAKVRANAAVIAPSSQEIFNRHRLIAREIAGRHRAVRNNRREARGCSVPVVTYATNAERTSIDALNPATSYT